MKKLPIHINNAMAGAPDLFVVVAELEGDPDESSEVVIKAGAREVVSIPDSQAVGFLIPVKQSEDPWKKLQLFMESITGTFLQSDEGKAFVAEVEGASNVNEKGFFEGLIESFGFGVAPPTSRQETKAEAVDLSFDDVVSWADGVRSALGTEHADRVTDQEAEAAACILEVAKRKRGDDGQAEK